MADCLENELVMFVEYRLCSSYGITVVSCPARSNLSIKIHEKIKRIRQTD